MIFAGKRLSLGNQILFLETLFEMVEGGLPYQDALKMIAENDALGECAEDILEEYTRGIHPLTAMTDEDFFAPEVAVILRSAGRENFGKGLKEALRWLTMEQNFRRAARSALIYPSVVFFVAHVVFYIILTAVIPRLQHGLMTRVHHKGTLFLVYMYMSQHLVQTVTANILFLVATAFTIRSGILYWVLSRLPGISKVLRIRGSAMFFTILSILTDAGLPLNEALSHATNVRGFEAYSDDIRSIEQTGVKQFFESLYEDGKIDAVTRVSILTGITSSNFGRAVRVVAEKQAVRFDDIQKNMTKTLEPLIVAFSVAAVIFLIAPLYVSISDSLFSSLDRM